MLERCLKAFAWAGLLVLCACASAPKQPAGAFNQAGGMALQEPKNWGLQGRVAVKVPKDSWSASIQWRHSPEVEAIKLSGPLGQGAVSIELTGGRVKIDRGGGNIQTSNQPEQFIDQQLGLMVPITALRYWAIGIPSPKQPHQSTIDGFVQDGWLITYISMQPVIGGQLPRLMSVSDSRVKLKLIVDEWDWRGGEQH